MYSKFRKEYKKAYIVQEYDKENDGWPQVHYGDNLEREKAWAKSRNGIFRIVEDPSLEIVWSNE